MTLKKIKNKGGRPKAELNKNQVIQVEALAAYLTCEQIADYFGISSTTFNEIKNRQPEVAVAYKKGRVGTTVDIASSLISKARDGDTTCQIFYLKTRAGWNEKQIIESKNTTPHLRELNIQPRKIEGRKKQQELL